MENRNTSTTAEIFYIMRSNYCNDVINAFWKKNSITNSVTGLIHSLSTIKRKQNFKHKLMGVVHCMNTRRVLLN